MFDRLGQKIYIRATGRCVMADAVSLKLKNGSVVEFCDECSSQLTEQMDRSSKDESFELNFSPCEPCAQKMVDAHETSTV